MLGQSFNTSSLQAILNLYENRKSFICTWTRRWKIKSAALWQGLTGTAGCNCAHMPSAAACLPAGTTLSPSGSLAWGTPRCTLPGSMIFWSSAPRHAGLQSHTGGASPPRSPYGVLPHFLDTSIQTRPSQVPFSLSPCRQYAALFFFTNSAETIYLYVNVFLLFSHQNAPRSPRAACVYSSPSPSARSPEALRATRGSSQGG